MHGNATAHKSFIVTSYLKDNGSGVSPHPPYILHLAPCNVNLTNSYAVGDLKVVMLSEVLFSRVQRVYLKRNTYLFFYIDIIIRKKYSRFRIDVNVRTDVTLLMVQQYSYLFSNILRKKIIVNLEIKLRHRSVMPYLNKCRRWYGDSNCCVLYKALNMTNQCIV